VGELRENVQSVQAAVGRPATTLSELSRELSVLSGTLDHLHTSHVEKVPRFRRWRPNLPLMIRPEEPAQVRDPEAAAAAEEEAAAVVQQPPARIPWGLVIGVTVDAGVDGLLIGLANTASAEAGLIMALATSIEMVSPERLLDGSPWGCSIPANASGLDPHRASVTSRFGQAFLGLSFSASVGNAQLGQRHRWRHLGLIALPPAVLMLAGVLAGLGGELLIGSPVLFVGLIGFSIVALLFLVRPPPPPPRPPHRPPFRAPPPPPPPHTQTLLRWDGPASTRRPSLSSHTLAGSLRSRRSC
jgi:hypothetical protein